MSDKITKIIFVIRNWGSFRWGSVFIVVRTKELPNVLWLHMGSVGSVSASLCGVFLNVSFFLKNWLSSNYFLSFIYLLYLIYAEPYNFFLFLKKKPYKIFIPRKPYSQIDHVLEFNYVTVFFPKMSHLLQYIL